MAPLLQFRGVRIQELKRARHFSLMTRRLRPHHQGIDQRNTGWWTVFACLDLAKCEPTAKAIQDKTQLPMIEIQEALDGLCLLGYLVRQGERFEQVPGRDFLHFDYSATEKTAIIDRHGLVSQQILNDLAVCDRLAFDHRCFAANDAILGELYKDLRAAFDKAFAQAQTSETNDRIFKMTFTAVDVLSQSNRQGNPS